MKGKFMKKLFLLSAAAAVILMSGCSSREPENMNDTQVSSTENIDDMVSRMNKEIQSVYFDFDSFSVKGNQRDVVVSDAALLNENDMAKTLKITIEGNCDESGSNEYNYALGLKRAKSIKDALIKQGVSKDRISVVSYGESNPVCTDKSNECNAKNRRGEIKVSK